VEEVEEPGFRPRAPVSARGRAAYARDTRHSSDMDDSRSVSSGHSGAPFSGAMQRGGGSVGRGSVAPGAVRPSGSASVASSERRRRVPAAVVPVTWFYVSSKNKLHVSTCQYARGHDDDYTTEPTGHTSYCATCESEAALDL
jgi:hypothetical protein